MTVHQLGTRNCASRMLGACWRAGCRLVAQPDHRKRCHGLLRTSAGSLTMLSVKMQCDRDEPAFRRCDPTALRLSPSLRCFAAPAGLSQGNDESFST